MTRLLLIRHGQTMWNSLRRYQGQTDVPLNEDGIKQALSLSKRLKNEKIDAIYSSDLERAEKTAEAVARYHNLKVNKMKSLREINFGIWEGKTYDDLLRDCPDVAYSWFDDPEETIIPEAESLQQVRDRALKAIDEIVKNHPNETVLVVSHGVTLSTIICSILEMRLKNMRKIKLGNTGISIAEFYDNKGIMTLFNDTNHLEVS